MRPDAPEPSRREKPPPARRWGGAADAVRGAAGLALLALGLLAPLAATAGGPGLGAAGRGSALTPFAPRDAHGALLQQRERLAAFTAERRFEARVRLLDAARDAELRRAEREIVRRGSLEGLDRHLERARVQEASDELRLRSQLATATTELDASWLARQGPVTRRVLRESGIRALDRDAGLSLRRIRREAELRARARDLSQQIRRAPPTPALGGDAVDPELAPLTRGAGR